MSSDVCPLLTVHFVYLGDDGHEADDTEFTAYCQAIPRTGEVIVPEAGQRSVVMRVYHKFHTEAGERFLYPTVVMKPLSLLETPD